MLGIIPVELCRKVTMDYVNINGAAIDFGKPAKRVVKRKAATREAEHRGFLAVGFSPQQFEAARKAHEAAREEARKTGAREMPPFSVVEFMRKSKPLKISKPFGVAEAAEECCRLAERAGWIGCTAVASIKS